MKNKPLEVSTGSKWVDDNGNKYIVIFVESILKKGVQYKRYITQYSILGETHTTPISDQLFQAMMLPDLD